MAAPPVGISKICSLFIPGHVIAYFSSTSAALNQPPVLPVKVGREKVNLLVFASRKLLNLNREFDLLNCFFFLH